MVRVLLVTACLIGLAGCAAAPKFGDAKPQSGLDANAADLSVATSETEAAPSPTSAETAVASIAPPGSTAGVLGDDPYDDLAQGKKQFHASNYGLAEQHFRKAAELHPNDAEAWVGLAASYDHLKRFDLADRAYKQAIHILGPTPEILNDEGFSYMLRGNYLLARKTLKKAQELDPHNPYILNNLNLLEEVARKGKGFG